MIRNTLVSQDTYEVVKGSVISNYDRKILTRLYQPIVGFGAIATYFTLLSELEADKTVSKTIRPHSVLFDLMDCTNTVFMANITKLEAIGLVKTYVGVHKGVTNYIYTLFAPKTPKEFFNYDLYVSLLQNKLSKKDFDRTMMYFKNDLKVEEGYAEVTTSFNDIFEVASLEVANVKNDLIDSKSNYPSYTFAFDAFYLKLKDLQFDRRKITSSVENTIVSLSAAFNISAYDMALLVQRSLDEFGKVSETKLKNLARRSAQAPKFEEKETKVVYSGITRLDEKIELMSNLSPIEFFKLINNNQPLLPREVSIINDFVRLTNLNNGVTNALLDFVVQKGDVISASLLQYWGRVLMNKHIEDAYQAMLTLQNGLTPKTKEVKAKTVVSKKEVEEAKNIIDTQDDEYEKLLKQYKEKRKAYAKD